MPETVVPLQTYLFQFLFLLVAIALEARVLYRRLRIPRKTSVEYATILNLLAASIGWLVFFMIQPWLPVPLKDQLISYIFFDRLLGPHPENLILTITAAGVVIFFSAFLIKLNGLEVLESWVKEKPKESDASQVLPKRRWPTLTHRIDEALAPAPPKYATTILLANAYSYSAIALLLFLRFLQIHTLR